MAKEEKQKPFSLYNALISNNSNNTLYNQFFSNTKKNILPKSTYAETFLKKQYDDGIEEIMDALRQYSPKDEEKDEKKSQELLPESKKIENLEKKIKDTKEELKKKGIEDTTKKSTFWGGLVKVLDVLDILRYPITNTIYHLAEGFKGDKDWSGVASDTIKGLFKGLLLLEKKDSKDVMDYVFSNEDIYKSIPYWGKVIIGIALDIVTDPTTYMTFGASSVLKKGKYTKNIPKSTQKTIQSINNLTKTFEEGVEPVVKSKVLEGAIKAGTPEEVTKAIGRYGKAYAQRVVNNINDMLKEYMSKLGKSGLKISNETIKELEDETLHVISKKYLNFLKTKKHINPDKLALYIKKISSPEFAKKYFPEWFEKIFTEKLSHYVGENATLLDEFLKKLKKAYNVEGKTYEEIINAIKKEIKFRDYGLNFLGKKLINLPTGKVGAMVKATRDVANTLNMENKATAITEPILTLQRYAQKYPHKFASKLFRRGVDFVNDVKEAFDVTSKWSKTYKYLHQDELLEFSKATVRKAATLKHFNKVKANIDELFKAKGLKKVTEKEYNDVLDDLIFLKETNAETLKIIAKQPKQIDIHPQEAIKLAEEKIATQIIEKIKKTAKIDTDLRDDIIAEIARVKEEYAKYKDYYDKIWNELHDNFDAIWVELVKRDLAKSEEKLSNYFPRYIKPIGSKSFIMAKEYSDIANIFLLRKIPVKKIGEIIGIDYLPPLESLGKYYDRAIKKIQNHDTVERIIKEVGFNIKDTGLKINEKAPDRPILLPVILGDTGKKQEILVNKIKTEFVRCGIDGFKNYFIPKEVDDVLTKIQTVILEESVGTKLLNFFNSIQNIWKKLVTVYNFPAFQHRNQISNTWTYILKDGVNKESIQSFKEAFNIMLPTSLKKTNKMAKVIKTLDFFTDNIGKTVKNSTEKTIEEIFTQLKSLGVIKGDFSASMIEKVGNELKFAVKQGLFSKFEDFASEYGAFWEDLMRTASFLNELKKGSTIGEAITNVDKWFINYVDLTKFEKTVAKTIFPFYTWIRKNLVNQLTAMAENPFKYKLLSSKMMEALDGLTPEEKADLPSYMLDTGWLNPFGIRWGEGDKKRILMLNPNLPFQDLSKIGSRKGALEALVSSFTPLLKTPIEIYANKNLYNKQSIEKYAGELKEVPALLQVIFLALPKKTLEGIGAKYDERGNLLLPAKTVYALENLLPVTRLSMIENPKEAMTGKDYQKERAPFKFIKSITGVTLTPLNVNYYRRRNLEDLLYKLKRLKYKQPTSNY